MPSPYPVWIEHSGLPRLLAEQSGGMAVWALLRTVITLDCEIHSAPSTLDVPFQTLADRAGFPDTDAVRETLEEFRTHKLAKMFLPDSDEENAVIQLATPLPTPTSHADVIAAHPFLPDIKRHRYCACTDVTEWDPKDRDLRELVDLYIDVCGCGINPFTIDKLRSLQLGATMQQIRWAFETARKNQSHDFSYIRRLALNLAAKKSDKR